MLSKAIGHMSLRVQNRSQTYAVHHQCKHRGSRLVCRSWYKFRRTLDRSRTAQRDNARIESPSASHPHRARPGVSSVSGSGDVEQRAVEELTAWSPNGLHQRFITRFVKRD